MTQELIKQGDIVRHFKGGLYRVMMIATDSETKEDIVIYHDVKDPKVVWTRPASEMNGMKDGVQRFVIEGGVTSKIVIHLKSNSAPIVFNGVYIAKLETENWHYYYTEDGVLLHFHKSDLSFVESGQYA